MSRHRSVRWILLPLLAFSLSACSGGGEKETDAPPPPRPVRGADVGADDLVHEVEVIGELRGKEEVRVFAQVPERIRRLQVSEGEVVKAGQLLAVLRGELLEDGVAQAEAGLEAAKASVEALEDQLRRAKALLEAGTLPRSKLDALASQLRAARAQERQLLAGLSAASNQKNRTVIRAPIAGVVAGLTLREGDMVAPSMPLCSVVDTSSLELALRVPERDFLQIRPGMPVTIAPLATPEAIVTSTVALVGPVVDRMSRTGLVKVALAPGEARLVPGSAVRVRIEVSRRSNVIQVPAAAIILTPQTELVGEAIAFVIEGKQAYKRKIKIGERQGDHLEVVEGLKLGERLVVSGAHLLRDGQAVADLQVVGGGA